MQNRQLRSMRWVGMAWYAGSSLVVPIAVGFLVGVWIDHRYHTEPWWTLGLGLLGIATGFVEFVKIITRLSKEQEEAERETRKEEPSN
jgi:ATP synthase protein I